MRYKCYDCDEVFDEDDAGSRSECVGEFWGAPAYESYMTCPNCGSDDIEEYEETEEGEDDGE